MQLRPVLCSNRRRQAVAFLVLGAAACGAVSAADVTSTWINQAAGTGNWNVASNWSNVPNVAQFPHNGNGGFTYDAVVSSPLNNFITLGQDITLQKFTLNGGVLQGPNTITVNEVFTFTKGEIRNAGITIPASASFVLNPSEPRITLTGTINNFGTGTWTGGGLTGDTFAALGVFNNHAGATFYANNSFGSMRAMGIGSFINAGTIRKTAGSESRWGNVTQLNNTGTVEVRSGMIRFVGPVAQFSSGVLSGGSWIVNPSGAGTTTLQLDQATGFLTTIGPGARVDISGASSVFQAANSVSNNQGFFRVANGYHQDALNGWTNSGTTIIGNNSLLQVAGTLANTGTIDVQQGGGIMVTYEGTSPEPAIRAQIVQARNGGLWDQPGITSSSARNATPRNTTLGILSGTEYKAINGPTATFFGVNVFDTSVLVKYTYYGDTDFNGQVNFDDYSRIDGGFNNGRTGWLNGDFDGNGNVNFDDYSLIDLAFNTQSGVLVRAVPEPSAAGAVAIALTWLSRRRRERSRG